MSANTIITSVVTGGSNNHTTTAEEANALATDFITQGVVGAITLNTGSGGTGSFCVNQNTGSNLAINILAGKAYITATPSSQNSQVLRARAASDYTAYTINSNSSGSTKYDWIYLKVDPTNANNPASDASDVGSIYTSRSSSNTTDNGTPPTYGVLLGYVTVANGASAITNSNITDKRFNASVGAQNGSLIVTQSATGQNANIQAAGIDASVNLELDPKGTGYVKLNYTGAPVQIISTNYNAVATGTTVLPGDNTIPQNTEGDQYMSQSITPKSATNILLIEANVMLSNTASAGDLTMALFQDSSASAVAATSQTFPTSTYLQNLYLRHEMVSGTTASTTFKIRCGGNSAGTTTFNGQAGTRRFGGVTISNIKITEYSV